jgi:phospholipase A1
MAAHPLRPGLTPATWGLIGACIVFADAAAAGALPPLDECTLQSIEKCVERCRDKYPGQDQRAARFACYDAAEGQQGANRSAVSTAAPAPPNDREASRLDALWDDSGTDGFKPYRQSYVLLARTNFPNEAPTSPNPDNRVPPTYTPLPGEAKLQFSLKALVLPKQTLGDANKLWFGYTQQSYWQIFDAANSRPFLESNYEPELIFSHRFDLADQTPSWRQPRILNVGLVHQSNGQSDPRSRSWNRIYAQLGWSDNLLGGGSYAVLVRPWRRFGEAPETDNNADIAKYLGHGDVEALYWKGPYMLSLLARMRSLQADFSMPMPFMQGDAENKRALQLHLQFFSGYGESLIDYNQSHTSFGFGLSVPYQLQ